MTYLRYNNVVARKVSSISPRRRIVEFYFKNVRIVAIFRRRARRLNPAWRRLQVIQPNGRRTREPNQPMTAL